MKLIIGGCRGTSPVAQPDHMGYGGETTAFLIEGAAGERILIDAGTGVRTLGRRLEESGAATALMLFTHYHLDHVAGLPSLGLIYNPRWTLEIASPKRGGHVVGEVVPRLMHKPFWPLQVEDLKARIAFTTLRGSASVHPRTFGGLQIRWCPVHHPDGCTAYRIDEPATGASCVIATDIEWPASTDEERVRFLALCSAPRPPGLVVIDGQYDEAEYAAKRGWGHTSWPAALELARSVGAPSVLVSHHDPQCDDTILAARDTEILRSWPAAALAREGRVVEVPST